MVGSSSGHDMNHEFGKKARKSMRTLKHIFDEYDHKLAEGFSEKKTAAYQLKMLGHENLNKTTMLYSRNLGNSDMKIRCFWFLSILVHA